MMKKKSGQLYLNNSWIADISLLWYLYICMHPSQVSLPYRQRNKKRAYHIKSYPSMVVAKSSSPNSAPVNKNCFPCSNGTTIPLPTISPNSFITLEK